MREFNAVELKDHLESCEARPFLLDVRQPWEYEVCKLEGSELIPMSQIMARVGELDPDKETVVICHHGVRSRAVARYLDEIGFSNVINLSGGVDGWAKLVDKDMSTY